MFAQIIQGTAKDQDAMRAEIERWQAELAAGAEGWLGTTAGVADDGRFFALARFEDEAAATRNSDRPEQGQWWGRFSQHLEGEATFTNSSDVELMSGGGSDDAGFVQVMQYRTTDAARLKAFARETEDAMAKMRPDVVGGVSVFHGDDEVTDVIYFTSEAEARVAEKQEPDPEAAAVMAEMGALVAGEMTFIDLRTPWLASP